MYDVIVIGGGVVGTLTLNELSKYKLNALLLEAEDDVATGASRANSGIVHAGYDCKPNSKKAYFNVKGHAMYPELVKELHVPYKMTGSLVVAEKNGLDGLQELYQKGLDNGVEVEIIDRKRILAIEPNVASCIKYALWAPKAGIVSPYKLTIAGADSAIINGAEIQLKQRVTAIQKIQNGYTVTTNKGQTYQTKVIINSAGAFSTEINKMLNDVYYQTEFRRGDYFVLDKSEIVNINTVIFPLPDHRGKGILAAPSADGNVLYGPTSVNTRMGDKAVTAEGLQQIKEGLARTYKAANFRKVIRLFAGVRAAIGDDFIIEESKTNEGFIMLMGICSPGLTSAPAIAEYVVTELVAKHINLEKKEQRKQLPKHNRIVELSKEELNDLIKQNPAWGRVICRCETVSEAEIVEAIHSPLKVETVDGVKRRCRAGMGRCQGGFCMPNVIKIISRELNIPLTEVKKGGESSEITYGKIEESAAK